jgi:hypothetical protein
VSNNLKLSHNDRIHVITWPNMGWKSTFLRQNALIALMSHIWYIWDSLPLWLRCKRFHIFFIMQQKKVLLLLMK